MQRKVIRNIFYLYILAAGALWGTICLYFNQLSALGLSRFQIMLLRIGIAAVFLGVYIFCTNRDLFKIEPVSYTHLDVYKRQVTGSTASGTGR